MSTSLFTYSANCINLMNYFTACVVYWQYLVNEKISKSCSEQQRPSRLLSVLALEFSWFWNSVFTILFKTSTRNDTTLQCIPLLSVEQIKKQNEIVWSATLKRFFVKERSCFMSLFYFLFLSEKGMCCKQGSDTNFVASIVSPLWQNDKGQSTTVLLHNWVTHQQTLVVDRYISEIS